MATSTTSYDHVVALYLRVNAQYILQACDGSTCVDSNTVSVSGNLAAAIGYIKASNTGAGDQFSKSIALSGDGLTLAVGADQESSDAKGINGDQSSNAAPSSGAVYVFIRNGNSWTSQAYVKASNTDARDHFGISVALSQDGNTLAVGATGESSNATTINGDQLNNSSSSGAAYVFSRTDTTWSQQAYIKAHNTVRTQDVFGYSVALSNDGNTLAVSDPNENSDAKGIDGSANNILAALSGATYVYTRNVSTWSRQAYIKASDATAGDTFGNQISLSGDGNTLAVAAVAKAVTPSGSTTAVTGAGAVYLFSRNSSTWSQQTIVTAGTVTANQAFGTGLDLAGDGKTLAVGTQLDTAYVFSLSNGNWSQEAALNAPTISTTDHEYGSGISLTADGNLLAISRTSDSGVAKGINGDPNVTSGLTAGSGAVFTFARSATQWTQQAYIKAPNTDLRDYFGKPICLSDDGKTLAIGALSEDSTATNINGDQASNTASDAGAVYLY